MFVLMAALFGRSGIAKGLIALLTMPIFVPIVKQLGLDPVWFGLLFCLNMQVRFLSPPFGPAAFYLESVRPSDLSLGEIFRPLRPFIALQLRAVGFLVAFPGIAIYGSYRAKYLAMTRA